MLKLLLLALPLIPVALAHAPSPEHKGTARADDPVSCEIRESRMPGGITLEGVVLSDKALSGAYAFEVRKQGTAGTSTSMQSGDFEAAAGRREVVGQVGVGLEGGASYTAELTISWPGGEASCVKRHPDRA